MKKYKLIIDAGSIAEPNRSGVGHTAYRLVSGLASDVKFREKYDITLVVAFNKVKLVEDDLKSKVTIRRVFVPGRVMNGLVRYNLLPPMDLFFGKGVYLFPNFKNWPLLFSKSITYIHDVYFKVSRDHIEPRNLSFLERHVDRFIKRSDRIITVSRHAKSEVEHFFPNLAGKVEVIYNGIDHEEFYPRPTPEQQRVGEKYGVNPGDYFMYLSNLEPRKNVGALLDAYKIYIDQLKGDKKLLLVGGMGWKNENVAEKIKKLQQAEYSVIKPTKYVPDSDIPALLSGATALVHPAFYEGFGLSPLQAIACGTPVVVGKNSSIPEVVGDSYKDYVDIRNPEEIANKMKVIEGTSVDDRLLRQAGSFTWKKATTSLIKEINSLGYNK